MFPVRTARPVPRWLVLLGRGGIAILAILAAGTLIQGCRATYHSMLGGLSKGDLDAEVASLLPDGVDATTTSYGVCQMMHGLSCAKAVVPVTADAGQPTTRLDRYVAAATERGWHVRSRRDHAKVATAHLERDGTTGSLSLYLWDESCTEQPSACADVIRVEGSFGFDLTRGLPLIG